MSIAYQCPSCLKTLYFEPGAAAFQNCFHCKGKILVPSDAVHQAEILEQNPTEYTLVEQKNLRLAEIHKELQGGNKIGAIALFRETFGTGLREAKEAVEALERGRRVDVSTSAMKQNYQVSQGQVGQALYPNAQADQQQAPNRIVFVVMAFLIALGVIVFIILGDG